MASKGLFYLRHITPIRRKVIYRNMGTDSNPPDTTVFITDVNTTEIWVDGDTSIPITGTGFV